MKTGSMPAEAGGIVSPNDDEAPVSTGFATLLALVELKRVFCLPLG
jgi:hypothetical protein